MSLTTGVSVVKAVFTGNETNGSVSIPGLLAGDVAFAGVFTGGSPLETNVDWAPLSGFYEKVVSVADEFQQISSTDVSTFTFTVYFLRGV